MAKTDLSDILILLEDNDKTEKIKNAYTNIFNQRFGKKKYINEIINCMKELGVVDMNEINVDKEFISTIENDLVPSKIPSIQGRLSTILTQEKEWMELNDLYVLWKNRNDEVATYLIKIYFNWWNKEKYKEELINLIAQEKKHLKNLSSEDLIVDEEYYIRYGKQHCWELPKNMIGKSIADIVERKQVSVNA